MLSHGVWTECFATMAAILSAVFPAKAPHFFAYLHTITKASRTFESAAWASWQPIRVLWSGGLSMKLSTPRRSLATPNRFPAVATVWQIPTPRGSAPMLPSKPQRASGRQRAVWRPGRPVGPAVRADICRLYNSAGEVSIPTVPVCTPMYKVKAPTPCVGVRRETPADTYWEPTDNGGGPGKVSPHLSA